VKTFGGTNDQFASAVAIHASGSIYAAGFFFRQITIDETTFTSHGQEDIFLSSE